MREAADSPVVGSLASGGTKSPECEDFKDSQRQDGQILLVSSSPIHSALGVKPTNRYRKYEHSNTFGIITSTSSNIVWSRDEHAENSALHASGAGRAIVGADEEVLCWDIKKGELISRWKDNDCSAEVTAITRSKADPDIYAVGWVMVA